MSAPGAFLIAKSGDGELVGCGGVQSWRSTTAEVKRVWIHADGRGAGLGRRLLGELENACRALAYTQVVLDTNATLNEAMAMDETAGYHPIEQYNDNPYAQRWLAKALPAATPGSS